MDTLTDTGIGTEVRHPLSPLTAEEIKLVSKLVVDYFKEQSKSVLFEGIELEEPDKKDVWSHKTGDCLERLARVSVFQSGSKGVWRLSVSISNSKVIECEEFAKAQPMIQLEEFLEIEKLVKEDQNFIEGCRKRGITDLNNVCIDAWSAGISTSQDEQGKHISHTFAWLKNSLEDNQYAHPIEGLNAIVDIKKMEVIRVDDTGVVPVPLAESNYAAKFEKNPRNTLRPINVVQPEGVSFEFLNGKLHWDKWSLVVGFNAREGLTLHDVRYEDRPLCFRASIAEMVVPYGSPLKNHARKNVFDVGEYGIGKLANSLELGCDCLGAIHYIDCWVSDINGNPMKIKNGICIHEEDTGILWKHYDFRNESTEIRRGRRLVISSISTVGNYDYAYYWYLNLDGEIEFEMKATGIINTSGCIPFSGDKYGTEVAPGVMGHIHQHIFCARLDMAIDGSNNSVYECDTVSESDPVENPFGNAFYVREKLLENEGGFERDDNKQRFWKFTSEAKKNYMGKNTAYKLEPSGAISTFHDQSGPSGQRMGFIFNQMWITPFDKKERYPAGDFVNGSDADEGLPAFVKNNRSIKNKDLVCWHVFGLHHLPRLEDYPVQPVVKTGFKLMPSGFFDKNPAIDIAAEKNASSCKV